MTTLSVVGNKCLLWLGVCLWVLGVVSASDNSECDNNDDDEEVDTWVADGGFFVLFLGVSAMFWGLAAGMCYVCV